MKKIIYIIVAFCFILSACAAPNTESKDDLGKSIVSPTPSPIPMATLTYAPITEPTATPFVPLTLEEVEAKLEEHLGAEVEYDNEGMMGFEDKYSFTNNTGKYLVDNETGQIFSFSSNNTNTPPEELLDEEGAKQVAIDELMKHCPEFFEYNYTVDMNKFHETIYRFIFNQISEKGRHTGNNLNANVIYDGTIEAFSIFYNEDPTTVDGDCAITEEQAVQAVYEASSVEAIKNFSSDKYEVEIDLQNKNRHEVTTYLTCFKGKIRWMVEIKNVYGTITNTEGKSFVHLFNFIGLVDANTGEVSNAGYGAQYQPSEND